MLQPNKSKAFGVKGTPKTPRPPKPPSQRINKKGGETFEVLIYYRHTRDRSRSEFPNG